MIKNENMKKLIYILVLITTMSCMVNHYTINKCECSKHGTSFTPGLYVIPKMIPEFIPDWEDYIEDIIYDFKIKGELYFESVNILNLPTIQYKQL